MRVYTHTRLKRPCRKCGEMFQPDGPHAKVCPKCNCKGKWRELRLTMEIHTIQISTSEECQEQEE